MAENTDKELDALKADMATLREDMAGLIAGMKESLGTGSRQSQTTDHAPAQEEAVPGMWSDLLHKLNASRVQGEKVVKGLAAEVEQQPLVSIVAAFGLGYIIAKLWYQENKE